MKTQSTPFEQASVADTAMSAPTMKKKKKKIGPRETEEELGERTPNGTKKKKQSRRLVYTANASTRTSEDVSLAGSKTSKTSQKKKQGRSSSVGPVDTDLGRKSRSRSSSVGPEDTNSRRKSRKPELNDAEDEPPMTISPPTKVKRSKPAHGTDAEDEPSMAMTPRTKPNSSRKSRSSSVGPVNTNSRRNSRSSSVGPEDTKSRRKSRKPELNDVVDEPPMTMAPPNKAKSSQPVHGTMELNDAEDEPSMTTTPRTKANSRRNSRSSSVGPGNTNSRRNSRSSSVGPAKKTVGGDENVPRKSFKTKVGPVKDDSQRSSRSDPLLPRSPGRLQKKGGLPVKDDSQRSSRSAPLLPRSPGRLQKKGGLSIKKSNPDDKGITDSDLSAGSDHDTIDSQKSFGNSSVVHLHKNISQLKLQVETIKEHHQAANLEASNSRTELISVKLEFQKAQHQRRGLRAELVESEAIVQDKDRKITALEKAVESQIDRVEELEEQLKKANDEIYHWQDKILHLEAQNLHMDEGSRSNHRAEEKNIQLDEQRHARLEKRRKELDEQLQEIQQERSHLEGLRHDNDSQRSGDGHLQQVESLKQIQAETAIKLSQQDEVIQELQRKLEVAWQLNMDGMESSGNTTGTDKQASEEKLLEEKRQLSATLERKDETIAYMQVELNRLKRELAASGSGDFASQEREVDARKAEAQVTKSNYQGDQEHNNSGVGDYLTDLPSGSVVSQPDSSSNKSIGDSLKEEMRTTPSQPCNNDNSLREVASLRGIRSMFSNLVSPVPVTNNSQ
jgi:hypothetical protein